MRYLLLISILVGPYECFSQNMIDTLGTIAQGIYDSKNKFGEVLTKVDGQDKKVIFVKIDNIQSKPQFRRPCEFDSIFVLFILEVELFHFGFTEFIEINEITLSKNRMKVTFTSKHHFNKPGSYNGFMIFAKSEENWPMKSLRLM